jgi:hypothetical protein
MLKFARDNELFIKNKIEIRLMRSVSILSLALGVILLLPTDASCIVNDLFMNCRNSEAVNAQRLARLQHKEDSLETLLKEICIAEHQEIKAEIIKKPLDKKNSSQFIGIDEAINKFPKHLGDYHFFVNAEESLLHLLQYADSFHSIDPKIPEVSDDFRVRVCKDAFQEPRYLFVALQDAKDKILQKKGLSKLVKLGSEPGLITAFAKDGNLLAILVYKHSLSGLHSDVIEVSLLCSSGDGLGGALLGLLDSPHVRRMHGPSNSIRKRTIKLKSRNDSKLYKFYETNGFLQSGKFDLGTETMPYAKKISIHDSVE